MTRILTTLFFLVLLGCSTNQTLTDSVRKQPKAIVPAPGVLWLKDNIYIDQIEITNFYYTEFLYWIQRSNPEQYTSLLPDTTVWLEDDLRIADFSLYYLRHLGVRDYPVVGISYDQAKRYCQWRTDIVNCMLYNKQKGNKKWRFDSTFNYPKQVLYRLPTREEWTYAATASLDTNQYPLGLVNIIDKHGKPISNTQEWFNLTVLPNLQKADYNKLPFYQTSPTRFVKESTPNKFGLYEMTGNVSELVEGGLVMGLNFKTNILGQPIYQENYSLSKTLPFVKPQCWIGFRCVCEILKTE